MLNIIRLWFGSIQPCIGFIAPLRDGVASPSWFSAND